MLVLVSYDIIEDSKRTKLAKKLLDFGRRVQYSVFECDLTAGQIKEMKKQALKFVDPEQDSLRIYRMCQACSKRIESFGVKKGYEDESDQEVIVI